MPTGQRIANWQVLRPATKVGRLNKYIEIPTFDQQCFKTNQSLYLSSLQDGYVALQQDYSGHLGFTFEAWVKKLNTVPSAEQIIISNRRTIEGDNQWKLCILNSKLVFTWLDATSLTEISVTSTDNIPHSEWCHVAVSWNANEVILYVNGQISTRYYGDGIDFYVDGVFQMKIEEGLDFYVDGAPVLSSNIFEMAQSANLHYVAVLGSDYGLTNFFVGYVAELRYWSAVQETEDIEYKYNKPRNTVVGDGIDDNLTWYFSMSKTVVSSVKEEISDTAKISLNSKVTLTTEEFPPLIYGASFIPINFRVITSAEHSLRFPVVEPEDCNFGLCVSWTDKQGDFQRRKFFLPEGVDIKSDVAFYKGENLPKEYNIEVWNIDGRDHVTLTEPITIVTSITAAMSSITDTAGVPLATLTADNLLAEDFPLTNFSLTFNTQQTY